MEKGAGCVARPDRQTDRQTPPNELVNKIRLQKIKLEIIIKFFADICTIEKNMSPKLFKNEI
jgi:hypothetical protein